MTGTRWWKWGAGVAAGVLAVVAGLAFVPRRPLEITERPKLRPLEPPSALRVLWVGHSLMNHRDPHVEPQKNLLDLFDDFARVRGLTYAGVDHTLFGAPLSLLWRGAPHSYDRSAPEMAERREHLFEGESGFDAVVLTEGVPVGPSLEAEASAFYLQAFRCAAERQNPNVRVYLYEAWSHLEASDGDYPPKSVYDPSRRLAEDRAHMERLIDEAASGRAREPGFVARLRDRVAPRAACAPGPIYLVPVGACFRELFELFEREELVYDGRRLSRRDLFANPHASWPAGWPLAAPLSPEAELAALEKLPLRHPTEDFDDIHPSRLGVQIAALVHFTTLTGQSPIGLTGAIPGLPVETARRIEEVVERVVRQEPRTGVVRGD